MTDKPTLEQIKARHESDNESCNHSEWAINQRMRDRAALIEMLEAANQRIALNAKVENLTIKELKAELEASRIIEGILNDELEAAQADNKKFRKWIMEMEVALNNDVGIDALLWRIPALLNPEKESEKK